MTTKSTKCDSNVIVCSPQWEVECFPGCCGASIIFRLEGECYDTQDVWEEDAKEGDTYYESIPPITRMGALSNEIRRNWMRTKEAPLNIAFGAVLDDMYCDSQHIFFATDNMRGTGDVHNGAFSTRNFVQWLKDNDLVNIADTPMGGRNNHIQGWGFTLKRRNTYNMLRRCRRAYVKWNNKLATLSEKHSDVC